MKLMKMISWTIYMIMDYQCQLTNCFLDNLKHINILTLWQLMCHW
jgi:hypothetical protein